MASDNFALPDFDDFGEEPEPIVKKKSGGNPFPASLDELDDIGIEEPEQETLDEDDSSGSSSGGFQDGDTDEDDLFEPEPGTVVPGDDFESVEAEADLTSIDSVKSALADATREMTDEEIEGHSFLLSAEESEMISFNLDQVISHGIDIGASDVHLKANDYVAYSVRGAIQREEHFGMIDSFSIEKTYLSVVTSTQELSFVENLELDASYTVRTGPHSGRRCRMSIGKSINDHFMVLRIINDDLPTPQDLGVDPRMMEWLELSNGLVMMNGPTGTGKSTTLASMLRNIQVTQAKKIITIERPVEYIFNNDAMGYIVQREVGMDTKSFAKALDSAMRQAPDVIMIGEVRNREEVEEFLRSAETGHLAISTMHTNSAAMTLNRIRSLFSGDEQNRILSSLAASSRGFANQVLMRTPDGKSRFAIREVLEVNDEVRDLIAVGASDKLREYQKHHKITMEHGLAEAGLEGRATMAEARAASAYPSYFDELVRDAGGDPRKD